MKKKNPTCVKIPKIRSKLIFVYMYIHICKEVHEKIIYNTDAGYLVTAEVEEPIKFIFISLYFYNNMDLQNHKKL